MTSPSLCAAGWWMVSTPAENCTFVAVENCTLARRTTVLAAVEAPRGVGSLQVQLHQSLGGLEVLQEEAEALVDHCEQVIRKLDRALLNETKQLRWSEWIERCQGIPGGRSADGDGAGGELASGSVPRVDAFIAFLGWTFESDSLVAGKAGAS